MRNEHIRYLVRHGLGGVAVGLSAAALMVALNVAQLRTLLAGAGEAWIGILLLGFGFAVTFGSAAMGAAIMALRDEPSPPRRGTRAPVVTAIRVPALARAPAPRR